MSTHVSPPHKSVLTAEVLEYLNPQPGKVYLDVTFGIGGHTRAILEHEPTCRVIALDWDTQALEKFGQPLQEEFGDRLELLWGNFGLLYKILKKAGITKVDGILADFGTSQVQISDRPGFSVYKDTPLDMRMSPSHQKLTAADILRTSSQEKLQELFLQLGGEHKARAIAMAIVQSRDAKPLETTKQLAALVEKVVGSSRSWKIHPATKTFQALRIYVNHELDHIHSFLAVTGSLLHTGGRLVCISFHSLEDRLVKQHFKTQELAGALTIITPKVVVASDAEVSRNPSARSARLRAAQKT